MDKNQWFDYKHFYTDIANKMPDNCNIIEIGSYLGGSISFLADVLNSLNKKYVISIIDNFSAAPNQKEVLISNTKNVKGLKIFEGDSTSSDIYDKFEDRSVDFIFIDGNHDYEIVQKDIVNYRKKLKCGGILAGHDYTFIHNGIYAVKAAVRDFLPFYSIKEVNTEKGYGVWYFNNDLKEEFKKESDFIEEGSQYITYIPHVKNLGLFKKAASCHSKNILCVDQSKDKEIFQNYKDVSVYSFDMQHFSSAMNFALEYCYIKNIPYMFFQHSDAYFTDTSLPSKMIKSIGDNCVLFTHYDTFCLFNINQIYNKIGVFDETFKWYVSDEDFYRRVDRFGSYVEIGGDSVYHEGSGTLKALTEDEKSLVKQSQEFAAKHYQHKWGGKVREEKYSIPYKGIF